jgi:hypothetical protein
MKTTHLLLLAGLMGLSFSASQAATCTRMGDTTYCDDEYGNTRVTLVAMATPCMWMKMAHLATARSAPAAMATRYKWTRLMAPTPIPPRMAATATPITVTMAMMCHCGKSTLSKHLQAASSGL